MGTFFASIGGKILMGVAVLSVLAGAYAWITTGAYNRGEAKGIADTTAYMKAAIAAQREATIKDWDRLKTLDRHALEIELWEKCMEPPHTEATCGPRP